MFGSPWYLCHDSVKKVCDTAIESKTPLRVVNLSTAGATNPLSNEKRGIGEKIALGLISLLLPPHRDNIRVSEYLSQEIGTEHELISWTAVRPDDFIEEKRSEYNLYETLQNGLFNAGVSSISNIGHAMCELATEEEMFQLWKGKMPHLLNVKSSEGEGEREIKE